MTKILALRSALAIGAIAAACGSFPFGAAAQKSAAGTPGDFDFYLFTLSVAPSFCDEEGYDKDKQECALGVDTDYQARPLTVHGLWPNKQNTPVRDQPQFCTHEELEQLPDDLNADLKLYMPGVADGLTKSEWLKHGTCSGLSQEDYFRSLVALAKRMEATIGSTLTENNWLGSTVPLTNLISKVAAKDPELATAIAVDCQFTHPRASGGANHSYIVELRVSVGKDLSGLGNGRAPTFVPINPAHLNSGCQNGAGYIPSGYKN